MGMRQIDIIGVVGKTQDATQATQGQARAHATQQDVIAAQQSARAEHAGEHVDAAAPEDRLELSTDTEGGGKGGGGGSAEQAESEASEPLVPEIEPDSAANPEHHVDFLA